MAARMYGGRKRPRSVNMTMGPMDGGMDWVAEISVKSPAGQWDYPLPLLCKMDEGNRFWVADLLGQ